MEQRNFSNEEEFLKRQDQTPLFDAIMAYKKLSPAYFCIPGHRFERGINQRWRNVVGDGIFSFDLTETPYTDDLHNAQGAIREAEELAREVFSAKDTHFLINGTTCGNEAMVISTAAMGEEIAIPRNAHKSALMGLIISGAKPIYIMPEISATTGLQGGITPEQVAAMFREHKNCKGVLVVSPTYFGLCSDLRAIADLCHSNNAVLLVDEAHGAHCYFSERLPGGALFQGADMCAQSIHKVSGSLTQSSMLHINSERVDQGRIDANLHLLQSTSPSYLLMTSLDMARHDLAMNGRAFIGKAIDLAEKTREEIRRIPGFACFGKELIGTAGIADMDSTRLTISAGELGINGFELKELLFNRYGCDLELANYIGVLAIVTFANEEAELSRLVEALKDISGKRVKEGGYKPLGAAKKLPGLPQYVLSPREAYFAPKSTIPWEASLGKVAGEMIAPYPPGIPLIYPGERINSEIMDYLEDYRLGRGHLHGPADPMLATVLVVE